MSAEIIQIGVHKFKHGPFSLITDALVTDGSCDLIYTDPPWGDGLIKAFERLRIKKDGTPPSEPIMEVSNFLCNLFILCYRKAKNVMFVEYGNKWAKEVITAATKAGFKYGTTIQTYYGNYKPHQIIIFYKNQKPDFTYLDSIKKNGTGIKNTVKFMAEISSPFLKANDTVFDPCAGLGLTGRMARSLNCKFIGNELTKFRLDKCIEATTK